jgi:hypothetical protein
MSYSTKLLLVTVAVAALLSVGVIAQLALG